MSSPVVAGVLDGRVGIGISPSTTLRMTGVGAVEGKVSKGEQRLRLGEYG